MASNRTLLAVVALVLASVVGAAAYAPQLVANDPDDPDDPDRSPFDPFDPFDSSGQQPAAQTAEPLDLVTADSDESYRAYVSRGRQQAGGYGGMWTAQRGGAEPAVVEETAADGDGGDGGQATGGAQPARTDGDSARTGGPDQRYSDTNVQVDGIDEPDVIKTDGTHIYYSGARSHATQVIDALPADQTSPIARVPDDGTLLLVDDTLVVIGAERVVGYDVSDPGDPDRRWEKRLDDRVRVRTARLHDGTVYLVTTTNAARCPVEPMDGTTVACTDVHHPRRPLPVDATYTVLTVDPASGDVADTYSFAGTRGATVYMSESALYVTYTERTSPADAQLDVLLGPARPILPDHVADRLEEVDGYDLSAQARSVEVQQTLRTWLESLDEDERERVRDRIADTYTAYVSEHKRDLTTTHVVRIPVGGDPGETTADGTGETTADGTGDPAGGTGDPAGGGLGETTVGTVPGAPLNQFSLDEHDGHLRIATTVGEQWRWLGRTWGVEPGRPGDDQGITFENDVYVLDAASLETTGSVTGMGETERIYSVRFDGDTGYVVTFRRIDPFHVLDLSDPDDPTLAGELKLPGYSTYMHPLGDDRVLGVGEEDGKVKLVVFDVSDPANPEIAESEVLDARWSAVARSHHAFLLDPRHEVFFLPTERGGHVYDYDLDRVATVDVDNPRRAVYIGDHLYVAGDDLVVVDETTWKPVERVDLY